LFHRGLWWPTVADSYDSLLSMQVWFRVKGITIRCFVFYPCSQTSAVFRTSCAESARFQTAGFEIFNISHITNRTKYGLIAHELFQVLNWLCTWSITFCAYIAVFKSDQESSVATTLAEDHRQKSVSQNRSFDSWP
jgi:hypothetical protein